MFRRTSGKAGVAAVEFAIVLPFLIVLLFGVIEFSLVIYNKAVLANASREGARLGIMNDVPPGSIEATVSSYCANRLFPMAGTAPVTSVSGFCTEGSMGTDLGVTVSYTYDFFVLPSFITTLTGSIDITGETVMKCM